MSEDTTGADPIAPLTREQRRALILERVRAHRAREAAELERLLREQECVRQEMHATGEIE